ncbi:unnamed protein product [Merluccius merluccius]
MLMLVKPDGETVATVRSPVPSWPGSQEVEERGRLATPEGRRFHSLAKCQDVPGARHPNPHRLPASRPSESHRGGGGGGGGCEKGPHFVY